MERNRLMLLLMLFMLLCDRSWARCKCDWFRLCRPCVFRKSFFSLLETFNKCILIWISSERWWCARMLLYNVQCTLRSPQNNCACVCERVGAGRPIRGCVWVYYTLNAASSGTYVHRESLCEMMLLECWLQQYTGFPIHQSCIIL